MFIAEPENAGECEWHTFKVGTECHEDATHVILDRSDLTDTFYPEGFHWAHGCDKHWYGMLRAAVGGSD